MPFSTDDRNDAHFDEREVLDEPFEVLGDEVPTKESYVGYNVPVHVEAERGCLGGEGWLVAPPVGRGDVGGDATVTAQELADGEAMFALILLRSANVHAEVRADRLLR